MPRSHVRVVRTMPEALNGGVVALRPAVPLASMQGTLALDVVPRHTPPAFEVADLAPDESPEIAGAVGVVDAGLRREVEAWAGRYAQAAVEIVGGDRPASQLVRWTAGEVYADLQRRALLVARAGDHQPGIARVQPVRPKVASVRATFVRCDVAEVSVRVRYGARSRAVAARFELRRDRWFCTALEFA